ncbi:hypothetical protein, partial [Ruegeria arenilitoris]|uniref:hypothetical protein n=1 Tax=Ruegeria arenilitoris TaxID=1173585 RepID=UPI001C2CADBB
ENQNRVFGISNHPKTEQKVPRRFTQSDPPGDTRHAVYLMIGMPRIVGDCFAQRVRMPMRSVR